MMKLLWFSLLLTLSSGCSEVINQRSGGSGSLSGQENAQEVGDESGFFDGDEDQDANEPTPDFDGGNDQIDGSDDGSQVDGSDGSTGDDDDGADSNDGFDGDDSFDGDDGFDGDDSGEDGLTGDDSDDDPPVLKTTPDDKPQHPGQNPGQNPYQGVTDSEEPLRIVDINYTGGGCPADSIATNISDDRQAFTILFAEFYVEYLGDKSGSAEEHCRVSLTLDVPPGWQISVLSTDIRGFAELNPGQSASLYSDYAFDARNPVSFTDTITDGDFDVHNELDVETIVWSECGATYDLDVDLTVAIDSPASFEEAVVTVDSLDGEMMHKFGLAWRECE